MTLHVLESMARCPDAEGVLFVVIGEDAFGLSEMWDMG